MAYQTSKARRNLQGALRSVSLRTRLAEKKTVQSDLREYAIAASIFLAHAEIENYVADILSAFSLAVVSLSPKGSKLPPHLQAHLFIEKSNARVHFGNFLAASSERDLLRHLSQSMRGPAGTYLNDAVAAQSFTGADVFTKIKYPSEDNLKKLFFRLGIDNLFGKLSGILKQDSSALLQSVSSLRTQLAHTGTLPGISCKDVRDKLKDTDKFVGALDRVMYEVTSSNFGATLWRTHLC